MVYRGHLQTDDPRDAPKLVRMAPLRTSRIDTTKTRPTPADEQRKNGLKIGPPKLRNINEIRESVQRPTIERKQTIYSPSVGKIKTTAITRSSPNSMLANLKDLEHLRNMALNEAERVNSINKAAINADMTRTTRMLAQKLLEASCFDSNRQRTAVTKLKIEPLTLPEEQPKAPARRRRDKQQQQLANVNCTARPEQDRPDILEGLIKESDRQLKQLKVDLGAECLPQPQDSDSESEEKKKGKCNGMRGKKNE